MNNHNSIAPLAAAGEWHGTDAPTTSPIAISVVIPAYGCTGSLRPLHARLTAVLRTLTEHYEIIFVDDRGPQDQWPILADLQASDSRVRAFRLSRNYGQQIAITAGLAESRGAFVVVMDCDLQDPPEFIPQLWATAQAGHDIVYASRRGGDAAGRRLGNRIYFGMMHVFAGYKVDPGQGSFSMLSRQVVDAFLRFTERERHYLYILRILGFDHTTIIYDRDERPIGKSSYTLHMLIDHAIQGFFFQSTVPLQWILWLGLWSAGLSLAAGLFFLVNSLLGNPPEGFTALMVVQLLIGGLVLTCVGTTGLYIGRVFESVKGRPLYLIDHSPPPPPSR